MEPRISLITLGVEDLNRSLVFYQKLGFAASGKVEDGIIFFHSTGTRLALYPREKLAEDIAPNLPINPSGFGGITLAHNTRTKTEVDETLALAVAAGGKLVKPAADTFWGGYSGYFSDPDGYYWEVAYADLWTFNDDGSLVLP